MIPPGDMCLGTRGCSATVGDGAVKDTATEWLGLWGGNDGVRCGTRGVEDGRGWD